MTISGNQIKLLHVARRKLRLPEAAYRMVLVELAGVTSSKDLDRDGFQAVMGYFEWLGFAPTRARGQDFGERPGMASFSQLELIRTLRVEFTRCDGAGETSLNAWLEHYWKVSSLRFLTMADARKVITALKSMKRRASA
ncbi:regulatory protein GemA [Rhodovulum sp. BSW8]|uniref:regulatory protein GemA n=1 Tax=Rhodovulum sp. BSW8 TaxID=2259645 RepID=UPI000DE53956|nr:regulatory protein GemA [Rhodovulum sp. BSW8]RBO54524.1 regulatory protein GemA [Rhodovulum sp. BSW8]